MKKIILLLAIALLLTCFITIITSAHSGGTDSSGGHTDHSTGEYHYHHGYSAHQHPNGVCPYKNSSNRSDKDSNVPMIIFMALLVALTVASLFLTLSEVIKNDVLKNTVQVVAYLLTILCGIALFANVELMFLIILVEALLAYIVVKIVEQKNSKK